MKLKLIVLFLFILTSKFGFAQTEIKRDTSVVKFVRALSSAIKERIDESGRFGVKSGNNALILLDKNLITIDSLYKYKFSDIKEININYDGYEAIYGFRATYGVIIIHKKEKKK